MVSPKTEDLSWPLGVYKVFWASKKCFLGSKIISKRFWNIRKSMKKISFLIQKNIFWRIFSTHRSRLGSPKMKNLSWPLGVYRIFCVPKTCFLGSKMISKHFWSISKMIKKYHFWAQRIFSSNFLTTRDLSKPPKIMHVSSF